jgi:Dolichyl-phosphate-mannose-protein mannosyltransferase
LGRLDHPGTDLAGSGEASEAALDAQQRLGISALLGLAEPIPLGPVHAPSAPRLHRRAQLAAAVPLLVVLLVQAALSIKLTWSNTAFQDEALYLWAGHLEISHLLHGTPIPPFATYFSGAPVIYPPLGAIADSLGGLAAARILSLGFMLGATALLWASTRRLYGYRAAFFAAVLFALLGLTLHVSAFATFDALATLFLALSVWCVIRATDRGDDATGWVLGSAVALTMANATAYSSAIFDPVVIILAVAAATSSPDRKIAIRRGAALFAYLTSLIIVAVTIGGGFYSAGIGQTVLARAFGTVAPGTVLATAGRWIAPLAALALLGAALAWTNRSGGLRRLLPLLFLGALLLAPVEQARIHTLTSLDKHVDIGAWFAAAAAGYALDRVLTWLRPRLLRAAAAGAGGVGVLLVSALAGNAQAASLSLWPNAADFVTAFGSLVGGSGRLLVEDPSIAEYYLPAGRHWSRWSSPRSIVLSDRHSITVPDDNSRAAALYAHYIAEGYFSIIALNFADTGVLDRKIEADISRNHAYREIDTIPYGAGDYIVWQRSAPGPAS